MRFRRRMRTLRRFDRSECLALAGNRWDNVIEMMPLLLLRWLRLWMMLRLLRGYHESWRRIDDLVLVLSVCRIALVVGGLWNHEMLSRLLLMLLLLLMLRR